MIAVNVSRSVRGSLDDQDPEEIRRLVEKWRWDVTDETARAHGDTLLAVARNTIVGVYIVMSWHRDPVNTRLVFELREAPEWQSLVGEKTRGAAAWVQGQANPVRIIESPTVDDLVHQEAGRVSARGWILDVASDGHSATVTAPDEVDLVDLRSDTAHLTTVGWDH